MNSSAQYGSSSRTTARAEQMGSLTKDTYVIVGSFLITQDGEIPDRLREGMGRTGVADSIVRNVEPKWIHVTANEHIKGCCTTVNVTPDVIIMVSGRNDELWVINECEHFRFI